MSKHQNQSISGTIQNFTDVGLDLESSLKEIIDNSIGANATNIRFFLDPQKLILYIIDNGNGMNKRELTKFATLNDRKDVSETKQGKYGQGVKLAFAFLTQLNGLIIVISKSNNYDASKEDSINQLIINFPEGIETNVYNPIGESACTANKNIWEKFSKTINQPNTGTLIKIEMDKRYCKELYNKIITDTLEKSIIANVGLINYQFLSLPNNNITFSTYEVIQNNEPEITIQSDYDNIEDDDTKNNNDETKINDSINDKNIEFIILENNDKIWDAECSEDFIDYGVLPFCPIGPIGVLESNKIQRYECVILQNSVKDINTIVFWNNFWYLIEEENVKNLSKKPRKLSPDVNEAAKLLGLGNIIKSSFYINLAHSDDWIQTHKNIISYIIDCDENELPKPSTKSNKNTVYRKLLSFVKGNYYSRNGTISLNSKLNARQSYGGDRDKNEFEDNIISLVEFPAKADKEFGVTVKKYSTTETIVHSSIRNAIYFLKKRWATDYNNELKRLEKEKLAKQIAEKKAEEAKQKEEQEAKRKEQEEIKRKEQEQEAKKKIQEETKRKEQEETKRKEQEETKKKKDQEETRRKEQEETRRKEQKKTNKDDIGNQMYRSSNVATYINKKDMCIALNKWESSNLHKEELEELVNFMCSEYKLYTESILEDVLKILNVKQKINHLRIEIEKKYKNDNDRVMCGSEFIKAYKEHF